MRKRFLVTIVVAVIAAVINMVSICALAQKFIHPGIDQTTEDLEYMKKIVLKHK